MNIDTIQTIFNEDKKLYAYMKEQYGDICSDGDIIINKILDDLNNKKFNHKKTNYHIDHIIDIYTNQYMKGIAADFFWAD